MTISYYLNHSVHLSVISAHAVLTRRFTFWLELLCVKWRVQDKRSLVKHLIN